MRQGYTKGLEAYIDGSIEDPKLREIDWNIAVYTLTGQMTLVLHHKWRRAFYLSYGHNEYTPRLLQPGYKSEVI